MNRVKVKPSPGAILRPVRGGILPRHSEREFEFSAVPSVVQDVLCSSGQPLDITTRSLMEARFGHDFSRVRVHTDARAAESAREMRSLAYTVGRNVVFGDGQYSPNTSEGRRVLAHELAHAYQQDEPNWPAQMHLQGRLAISDAEQEAEQAGNLIGRDSHAGSVATARSWLTTGLPVQVQRQAMGSSAVTQASEAEQVEFEEERQAFLRLQEEFFREVGETLQAHILGKAGFGTGEQPTTPDEALQVTGLWGLHITDIVSRLLQLAQSLSGKVTGSQTSITLDQQQQDLINALTPDGRQSYEAMLGRVRSEAFWREYLDSHTVYIFPDLSGTNRYGGYIQKGTGAPPGGEGEQVYIVHLSRDQLEAGQVDQAAAVLVHELSHSLYEPAVLQEALSPFLRSLAELLVDHPEVQGLWDTAEDPAQARQIYMNRIMQILHEQTVYAEEEIFAYLEELTHMPDVTVDQEQIEGAHYILQRVDIYVATLKRIGLPEAMLNGILDLLARRVEMLYERRIAAAPDNPQKQQLLTINKELALSILSVARSEAGTIPS